MLKYFANYAFRDKMAQNAIVCCQLVQSNQYL